MAEPLGLTPTPIIVGHIQPLFQWVVTVAASCMPIIFLLVVKQTSYKVIVGMTDWLFKFIDVIIKNHLKVSAIGTAPLLHQVSGENLMVLLGI
jgi:hypothetical protein